MWGIQKFGIVLRGKLSDFLMSEIRCGILDVGHFKGRAIYFKHSIFFDVRNQMWDFRFEMWNIQKFGIVLRGKLPDILMSEIRY